MKILFFRALWVFLLFWNTVSTYASGPANILTDDDDESIEKLRRWTFNIDDIPNILKNAAEYLLGFAGTVAMIFIIIGAYQWGWWSVTSDVSSGKKKVGMAIAGFALASLSWWLVTFVADNLAGLK